jgi:hypothetical protein
MDRSKNASIDDLHTITWLESTVTFRLSQCLKCILRIEQLDSSFILSIKKNDAKIPVFFVVPNDGADLFRLDDSDLLAVVEFLCHRDAFHVRIRPDSVGDDEIC